AVVVAGAGGAEGDLVAVAERHLSADALAVDVGAVEAAEVAQHEPALALLEDAVLLRDDLVEQLDRIVGVPAQAVDGPELDRLLPLRRREDQSRHRLSHRTVTASRATARNAMGSARAGTRRRTPGSST